MEYIVYVLTNSNRYIIAVDSSAFLTDTTDWVEIDRGYGDKYHHAQGNYVPEPIYTDGGAYRYKLIDGKIVECTPEEIAEQEAALQPEPVPPDDLAERVAAMESDVAALTTAIEKGLAL